MATFSDGLHLLLHINYGDANMLANISFAGGAVLPETVLTLISGPSCACLPSAPWVNLFTPMFAQLNIAEMNMVVRILVSLAGTACMGLGLGLYVAVDCGLGAMEGIVMYCREKFHMSVGLAKIIQDVVLTPAGHPAGRCLGRGNADRHVLHGTRAAGIQQVLQGASHPPVPAGESAGARVKEA